MVQLKLLLVLVLLCWLFIGDFWVTHYSCSWQENTEWCITASGKRCSLSTAASYPGAFRVGAEDGDILYIEGIGTKMIQDTGWGPDDGRPWVDVWRPTRKGALARGASWRRVYMWIDCRDAMLPELRK